MPIKYQPTYQVIEFDVEDGGILGALIVCPICTENHRCKDGFGCDGTGLVHRPYRLPIDGGYVSIDLHAPAVLIQALRNHAYPDQVL